MKKVILVIIIFVLIVSVGLMTYMLSDGTSILGFSLRAANEEEFQDPFLSDLQNDTADPADTTNPANDIEADSATGTDDSTTQSDDSTTTLADETSAVVDDGTGINAEADSTAESDQSLLAYNSTSPTPEAEISPGISGSISPSVSPSISAQPKGGVVVLTLTPTLTPTITPTMTPTPTPTVISELPESGITDHVNKILIGGGILILLAFLL